MTSAKARVEAFYARDEWRDELAALRQILRGTPLIEDFKWSSPVYTHDGGNVAIVWRFRDRAALGFFKGALLDDAEGILAAHGENSRSMRTANFTSVGEIGKVAAILGDYLAEAIRLQTEGRRVEPPGGDPDYPPELLERLDGDAAFRAAFEALTPGRRRGWALNFSQAKQSETRARRIEKAVPRILDGKGMHDR